MKRRDFVKNGFLASVATPFIIKDLKFQALGKPLFSPEKSAEDKVLVIIKLGGGNDGLNTIIPLDQYDHLAIQRPNIILPKANILSINTNIGMHPSLTGFKSLFDEGKMSIIQNVGYPEQNRSHFRSSDIWNTGLMDPSASTGWLGRNFDNHYPNFPADYPNNTYTDPFAISIGSQVSATCQGLRGNFSHCVDNPSDTFNLAQNTVVNDGTYFGSHMEFLNTIIEQTNAYGSKVTAAINAVSDSNLSTFDTTNEIAVQLRYVAKMIKGGLKSKVYILNLDGFDTHDSQVSKTDVKLGNHSDLLKTVSDALKVFHDDLATLNIDHRVAGMTYSEFGRQIASNASLGTDHGDAAPLFLFGTCVGQQIVGPNPVITDQIVDQAGIPMQIDFRNVYASILKNWFEISETDVQALFEHQITFYNFLNGCAARIEETVLSSTSSLLYPNPASSITTVRFDSENEWVKIELIDFSGKTIAVIYDGNLVSQSHQISIDLSDVANGEYIVSIKKASGYESLKLIKVKSL